MASIPLGALASGLAALPPGADSLPIEGVALDSRKVRPGFLFAALPGSARDGGAYIAEAVSRGAVAVLAPPATGWPEHTARVPLLTADEPRRVLARLAARHAGAQPERMVAVTGTNGNASSGRWTG
jgi:UDP-N-acetylmuramoyl-L-alanyl-D-glutamate--2,6-diaminopimelate ligase